MSIRALIFFFFFLKFNAKKINPIPFAHIGRSVETIPETRVLGLRYQFFEIKVEL